MPHAVSPKQYLHDFATHRCSHFSNICYAPARCHGLCWMRRIEQYVNLFLKNCGLESEGDSGARILFCTVWLDPGVGCWERVPLCWMVFQVNIQGPKPLGPTGCRQYASVARVKGCDSWSWGRDVLVTQFLLQGRSVSQNQFNRRV